MNSKNRLLHPKTLLIVTGGPGTGKSYAARAIREGIDGLTLLSYDAIKEKEWDRFGFDDREQKLRVTAFCLEEFYLSLQHLMYLGKTILIEYPFNYAHRPELSRLIDAYDYRAVTVLLYGDWRVIYDRGISRDNAQASQRHPGHLTNRYHIEEAEGTLIQKDAALSYEEFRADIDRKNYDIDLGRTIRVDVTDLARVDLTAVVEKILKMDAGES